MPTASNLYAEKVFSEHPIALWAMDEKVDYVSLIDEPSRDMTDESVWAISGGTASIDTTINSPFDDSVCIRLQNSSTFNFSATANSITDLYINPVLKTVSLGFYAYAETENIQSIDFGLLLDPPGQPLYSNTDEQLEEVLIRSYGEWNYYSKTFSVPDDDTFILTEITVPIGLPAILVKNNHGLQEGNLIFLSTTGNLPGNIKSNTPYYVRYIDNNSFNISLKPDSDLVIANSLGFGDHNFTIIKSVGIKISAVLTNNQQASLLINGLSLGQWSEEFQENSLGIETTEIDDINLPDGYSGIAAKAYGLQEYDGFYLCKNNKLLAKNTNIPLTFGSSNVTNALGYQDGEPSIIFPGLGVLNESGKYQTATVEMWLRLASTTKEPKRIFGPIASDDGIYVDGPFLILRIGNNFKSHYVGDFYRPILLDLVLFENGASVIINGEKIFDMQFISSQITFPDNLATNGKNQDWLAFYTYEDVQDFNLDAFGIYPYRVSTSVAKRRYVYGQGVDFPEKIVAPYNGKSFQIDYSFSNFGNNYIYPDISAWRGGTSENVSLAKDSLAPREYVLPSFIFNNKTYNEWLLSVENNNSNAILLRPDEAWTNTSGYIFFDKVNLSQLNTKAMYGVFESKINFAGTETLFKLENSINKNSLDIKVKTQETTVSAISDAQSLTLISSEHKLKNNDIIKFSSETNNIPITIIEGKEYLVRNVSVNSFQIAESINDDPLPLFKEIESIALDAPGVFFVTDHNLFTNDKVIFDSTQILPEGLEYLTEYYVKVLDSQRFIVSTTEIDEEGNGNFVTISSNGTGRRGVKRVFSGIISASKNIISYELNYQGSSSIIYETPGITLGHSFVAGIEFDKFANTFGGNVSAFLGNKNQLKVYVAGNKDFSGTFSGSIYAIGFSTFKNLQKISYLFDTNGIPFLRYQFDGNGVRITENSTIVDAGEAYVNFINDIVSHKASYTLVLRKDFGIIALDIATESSWKDSIPLTYFAKTVTKEDGKKDYGLDYLQFNIDYPESSIKDLVYDTEKSSIKTYISFNYTNSLPIDDATYFNNIVPASSDKIVSPSATWMSTKYEVVNGSIIYLPEGIDFNNLSISIYVEMNSDGIFAKPIRIRRMGIAGRSLNKLGPNSIKSKFGLSAYPYNRYGFYFDYKSPIPFSIYKDDTPYLYLTKDSGIQLYTECSEPDNYPSTCGILFPINIAKSSLFNLSAIQLSFKIDNTNIDGAVKIFEVESLPSYFAIIAKSIHPENKRVQLYAVNQSGEQVDTVGFYLNGKLSYKPVVSLREWNMLGIAFINPIDMNEKVGSFNLTGSKVVINNLSYYSLSSLQESQRIAGQANFTKFSENNYFGISPSNIYDVYIGTNKIIGGDNLIIRPQKYQYSSYKSLQLQTQIVKPV